MDPITHAALGAACAQTILYRSDKQNAWLVGALAGMAPDLDIFIRSSHDPMWIYIFHRHFTHSLLFIPLGGFLVGLGLLLFKRFRLKKWATFTAACIGYATHSFLDAATTYGTQLFWPFSDQRVSWDLIAIVDPFFTIPLILGLIWTWMFTTRKGVLVGLLVAGVYFAYCVMQHSRAMRLAYDYGAKQFFSMSGLRALPEIGTTFNFRIIAHTQDKLWVAEASVPWFAKNSLQTVGLYPKFLNSQLPDFVVSTGQQLRDFKVFSWFSDGYMITASTQPLILVDARFLMGNNPVIALWGIKFIQGLEHIQTVGNIPLESSK